MINYDERLNELQEQIASKNRLETVLKTLRKQQEELEEKVAELECKKWKEQADVECMEKRSLTNFFYYVVGKMDEKLTAERQEAYQAAVSYDVACKELEAVKKDIKRYELEYGKVHRSEEQYQLVLKEKIEALKLTGTPEADEIQQLEEKITRLATQEKEIQEAISAGKSAKYMVESIMSSLSGAEGWGTWDLLGGGLIADISKYGYLEEAQYQVEKLQIALRRFQTELEDVQLQLNASVNIDGFLRFADYFLDGLVADWLVLEKINASQLRVRDTSNKLEQVLTRLNAMLKKVNEEQAVLKGELNGLVRKTKSLTT